MSQAVRVQDCFERLQTILEFLMCKLRVSLGRHRKALATICVPEHTQIRMFLDVLRPVKQLTIKFTVERRSRNHRLLQ